jgi:hypothetical protein
LPFLSSSGLRPVLGVLLDGGHLAVGLGHELLEHVVERLRLRLRGLVRPLALIAGRMGGGISGLAAVVGLVSGLAALAALPALIPVVGRPGAAVHRLSGGHGERALDGQIDLVVVEPDDHDLHVLPLGEVVVDVVHIGVRDLGDVHHAGRVVRQRHERAELGETFDLAVQNCTNCKLHTACMIPHLVCMRFSQSFTSWKTISPCATIPSFSRATSSTPSSVSTLSMASCRRPFSCSAAAMLVVSVAAWAFFALI